MEGANWRKFDFWLLGAVALLTIFGITMIRSAVAGNIELEEANVVQRQIIFAVGGFIVVFIVSAIDYHLFSAISQALLVITGLLLAALTIAGQALYGSARWFDTGVILIQPSELAKIVVILVLAEFFARNQEKLGNILWIGRSLLYALWIMVWILLQPNLSTSLVILVIWFALLWASGLKVKYLAIASVVAIILPFVAYPFLEEYQQDRITNFLFPDPEATHGETYNIEQALVSIGSGGLFGKGYFQGTQNHLRFLKVRWSDFIFSASAEEFGLIGMVILMLVLLFVIYRCLRVAMTARDTYGALIAYGVATLLAFQGMVNIGVNLRLVPATGLPLPFVSYGGSALLSLLLGIGLVESVALRRKPLDTG
jgi:rod shape determining protein RodA